MMILIGVEPMLDSPLTAPGFLDFSPHLNKILMDF